MKFNEWQDFVRYPKNANKVTSRSDRLDTSRAFYPEADGQYSQEFFSSSDNGAVVQIEDILWDDDEFEAMEIDDLGHVLIWTRDRVWFFARQGKEGTVEKLIFLQRNPPAD